MPSRDSNNATWYLLRYPENFRSAPPGPHDPTRPLLDPTLFYDDARGVLELLPAPAAEGEAVEPLPGVAVDVNGEVYRGRRRPSGVVVRRCDGSEEDLVCEPHVFASRPGGMALDRRGYLYVSDRKARRVVVLRPEDGSVAAVLDQGLLREPVDVATSAGGRIFVADRGGRAPASGGGEPLAGRIAVYSARHARLWTFSPSNAEGLPEIPRPIAVMVAADGALLVADAHHPRLLRFSEKGEPLGDVELAGEARALAGGEVALDALERAYGRRLPRFLAGLCRPPRPDFDGGLRLAEVHRAIRLLALSVSRRFESEGVFLSAALDGGTPGVSWHRVEVEADLPAGASLRVETATADDPSGLDPTAVGGVDWRAPVDRAGAPIPITAEVPEQLVQSPPGRYLRLRVTLSGDGAATPSLRSIRVLYPRVSYLDLLPAVYRRDPEAEIFLERFLALFELVFTGIEDRYEEFSRELNPDGAPREVIDWLACLIDLAFDPSWPLARRRALVAAAIELYRLRGTVEGIKRYLEIYTGIRPEILEGFLRRPRQPAFLGRPGAILGCGLQLQPCAPDRPPRETLDRLYAHRFTVVVYLEDDCDETVLMPVVNRIVETNRPAHTVHNVCIVTPDARLGQQSTVGLDLVVGARGEPHARLGGCPEPVAGEGSVGVLGVDTVLSERRQQYARRHEERLT